MAVALTRIEVKEKQNRTEMVARLYQGELRNLIGDPSHIYRTLKSLTITIPGHTIFMEDGQGNFKSHAIVTDADYTDGVFTIHFNERLREYVLELEKNYTTLELAVLTGFHRNCSFRLYELLKKEMHKSKSAVNEGKVDVEYNISELKFMIGIANAENQTVKNAMGRMGEYIDWDALYENLDKKDKLHSLKKSGMETAKWESPKADGYIRLNTAKGVVLSTGGYEHNLEKLKECCRSRQSRWLER